MSEREQRILTVLIGAALAIGAFAAAFMQGARLIAMALFWLIAAPMIAFRLRAAQRRTQPSSPSRRTCSIRPRSIAARRLT